MSDDVIRDYSGKILTQQDVKKIAEELQQLIKKDEVLSKFRNDDEYLLRFLYSAEFNVTSALKKLQDFRNFIIQNPEWTAHKSSMEQKSLIEKNEIVLLPGRDKSGGNILLELLGKFDPKSTFCQQSLILDLWVELIVNDPGTRTNGLCVLVDMDGFSWGLLKWLTPYNLINAARKVEVQPLKSITFHVVNTSFLLNAAIKISWPFLSNKVKEQIKFHYNNWSSLHDYISPENLPKIYGGTGPDIDFEKSNKLLFDDNDGIKSRLKYNSYSA